MDPWLRELHDDLRRLEAADLLRELRVAEPAGRLVRTADGELVNLASNDYLGLAGHPRLRAAAIRAIEQYGTGAGASRLIVGHQPLHAQVEQRFAAFKHAEAALLCPTGYLANLAVLTALAGPGDLICVDKLNHASLLDAARASGATLRVFPHLQYGKLERLLGQGPRAKGQGPKEEEERRAKSEEREETERSTGTLTSAPRSSLFALRSSPHPPRRFIVTDSIFSMDGDAADLPALCDLADRYDAILIVDEAHATGVLGATGAGLCELQGVAARVDVVVSTASKALGGLGGIVTAQRPVIDTLINHARAFIYTTAVPPAQAAALDAALDVLRDEPWRRQRVLDLAARVSQEAAQLEWAQPSSAPATLDAPRSTLCTPIIPLVVGTPRAALDLAAHLKHHGLLAPAIRPPTVAPGSARVRLSLRADLEDADVDRLIAVRRGWSAVSG